MSNKTYDLIVWDWDGTLADSTGMITQALVSAAEQVGLPKLDPDKARSIIGLGLKESIQTLYGNLSMEQARELAAQYHRNYYAGEREIPLFLGAADTVISLHKKGYKLAVATGKGRRGLNLALEHCGLGRYFHDTRTVDECFSKPHPQMLDELMDALVVRPERTLMIGDTSYDLQMARNAGVDVAAVTFGAQTKATLVSHQPNYLFDAFSDLKNWLLHEQHSN